MSQSLKPHTSRMATNVASSSTSCWKNASIFSGASANLATQHGVSVFVPDTNSQLLRVLVNGEVQHGRFLLEG